MASFTGKWHTTFGTMELTQHGNQVTGTYWSNDEAYPVEGTIEGRELTGTYSDADGSGETWFALKPNGEAFTGQYRAEGAEEWATWDGTKIGFAGVWDTTYGLLRLIEEGELVRGFYEPGATLQGGRSGDVLEFTYHDAEGRGSGQFTLAEDGLSFDGEWQAEGAGEPTEWTGERVLPAPAQSLLMVIEAPWEKSLKEKEYSFGNMLWEFLARLEDVEVRQRYFANEESLQQYCREVMYVAEPVYLWISTHALEHGIRVNGKTISIPPLLERLRHVPDLRLVHFAACLLMTDPAMLKLLQTFSDQLGLPISGYTTSVDWGESAIVEFTYVDLILSRGYTPEQAADELLRLLPFAGDEGDPDGVFPPAGFHMVTPR